MKPLDEISIGEGQKLEGFKHLESSSRMRTRRVGTYDEAGQKCLILFRNPRSASSSEDAQGWQSYKDVAT